MPTKEESEKSLELSFKHLPLSRIGCDTLEHWENKLLKKINWNGRNSAYLNLTDTIGHALTNKIIYSNDPDVIFIRNENCSLSKEEKLLIGTWAYDYGYNQDEFAEERLTLNKDKTFYIDAKYYNSNTLFNLICIGSIK